MSMPNRRQKRNQCRIQYKMNWNFLFKFHDLLANGLGAAKKTSGTRAKAHAQASYWRPDMFKARYQGCAGSQAKYQFAVISHPVAVVHHTPATTRQREAVGQPDQSFPAATVNHPDKCNNLEHRKDATQMQDNNAKVHSTSPLSVRLALVDRRVIWKKAYSGEK